MKKWIKAILTLALLGVLTLCGRDKVSALGNSTAAVDGAVEIFAQTKPYALVMDKIENDEIIASWKFSNNYTTDSENGNYEHPYINITGFELEISTDSSFSQEVEVYKTDVKGSARELHEGITIDLGVPKSILGKNGTRLYARVRAVGIIKKITGIEGQTENTSYSVGDTVYTDYCNLICWGGTTIWSNAKYQMDRDYAEFVKINKANFSGMYKLMKSGYMDRNEDGEKDYYDDNRDGWLDPSEISQINEITNYKYGKSDTDNRYCPIYSNGEYQCKLSNLKGLEKLPFVSKLYIRDYSPDTIDLSDYPKINHVDVRNCLNKKLTLIAPHTRDITISSEIDGARKDAKLETVDVSKCESVVRLQIDGSYYRYITVKLPKDAKNLLDFSISFCKDKSFNMNKFTKLMVFKMYAGKASAVKLTKCRNIRYVYFYCCDKISSVDLRNAKKFAGADIYNCKKLTSDGIKKTTKAKITENQGRWWESTKAFRKIWQQIVDEIGKV